MHPVADAGTIGTLRTRSDRGEYVNSGNIRPVRQLTIEATVNLWSL